MALDGASFLSPDEKCLRYRFLAPGSPRGAAAFPKLRVSALTEVETRVFFEWRWGRAAPGRTRRLFRQRAARKCGTTVVADGYDNRR